MELFSLHPLPELEVATYLRRIASREQPADGNTNGDLAAQFWYRAHGCKSTPRPNDRALRSDWLDVAHGSRSLHDQGLSLSSWEARVDRGSGMMLRPPSRLFVDAGLDADTARANADSHRGGGDAMMGGAFVPARLYGTVPGSTGATQLERSVRRLNEAELDGPELMALILQAARYANQLGYGLYEAVDLLDGADSGSWPPGASCDAHEGRAHRSLRSRHNRRIRRAREPSTANA